MPLIIEQDSEELRKKPLQLSKQTKDELTVANALVSNLKNVNGKTKGFKRIKGIVQDAFGKSENEKLNDVGIHINGEQYGEIKPITFNKAKRIIHDAQKMSPFEKQMLSGTVRDLETSIKRERNSNKVTKQFKPELPKVEKPKTAKDQSIKPLKLPNGNELRLVAEMFSPNDDMWTMERQKMDDSHPYWRKVLEWTYDGEYGIDYVLECFVNNENPFLPLIDPMQYQRVLDLYTQGKDIPPILEKKIYQWIGIIMKNTHLVEVMNELCGNEKYYPTEDVLSFFGIWDDESKKEFEEENNVDFSNMDDDNICDYILEDFCKQKYGKSFWNWEELICTDFGMKPIYNILSYYKDDSSVEDCILIVNKALDWWHWNGDLSIAFIPGGRKTLSTISNHHFMGENKKKKLVLTEKQLKILKEYHNQLHINFDDPNNEKSSIYSRPNYEHFIDFLEAIGKYGTLQPNQIKISDCYTSENKQKAFELWKDTDESGLETFTDYFLSDYGDEDEYFDRENYPEIMTYDFPNCLTELGLKVYNKYLESEFCDALDRYFSNYVYQNSDSNQIEIERVISLPEPTDNSDDYYDEILNNYDGIGCCWTWAQGYGEAYCKFKYNSDITIKAIVNVSDIDWIETIMRNGWDLKEEREIFLKDNILVEIREIEYNDKTFPLKQHILVRTNGNVNENIKNKKSIILPENKLIKLLEYRNQLNIPFEEFGSEKNGYKLCYEHYIDFLESIGQYGELPPTNYTMEDIEKIVYDNLDNVSFYDMSYGGDEQAYFEEALEWLNKGYYKYFDNYAELIEMDEDDLWNLWNQNKFINEKGILEIKKMHLKTYDFPYSMKLNNKGLIYVERAISLPNLLRQKDIYYNMKSWYNGVGECWSWSIGGAESFASCNLDNNKATSIIILKGWVSPDDINWRETTLCNCSVLNEEMEIRMSYGAKIQIDEIVGYYKKSKNSEEDDFNINGKKIPLEKPIIIST